MNLLEELKKENAQITRDVLNGKQGGSRTAVLMNAGAGLYIGGKAIFTSRN